jgi:hypothetical protein
MADGRRIKEKPWSGGPAAWPGLVRSGIGAVAQKHQMTNTRGLPARSAQRPIPFIATSVSGDDQPELSGGEVHDLNRNRNRKPTLRTVSLTGWPAVPLHFLRKCWTWTSARIL